MVKIEINQKEFFVKIATTDGFTFTGCKGQGSTQENMIWCGITAVVYGGINALNDHKNIVKTDKTGFEISYPKSPNHNKAKNHHVIDTIVVQLKTLHAFYPDQIILIDKELVQ